MRYDHTCVNLVVRLCAMISLSETIRMHRKGRHDLSRVVYMFEYSRPSIS